MKLIADYQFKINNILVYYIIYCHIYVQYYYTNIAFLDIFFLLVLFSIQQWKHCVLCYTKFKDFF